MSTKPITRRKLLKQSAIASIGASLFFSSPLRVFGSNKSDLTKVVLIRDNQVFDANEKINKSVLESMLDKAIIQLTGEQDVQKAWKKLLKPQDILGIKTNVWAKLCTPPELEEILKEKAIKAGLDETNISIQDRGILNDPVFEKSTALINVRPMRTHSWSGLGTLLKNYIMFVSMPSMYHGNACEKLGAIWQKFDLRNKTRLNILVMITPLFHGVGPHHFSRQYTWPYCGLIVSTDPVAADATGARIIQAKRNEYFGDERPISPRPLHIEAADTRFNLGNSHPDRIELIKLGWKEGIFI